MSDEQATRTNVLLEELNSKMSGLVDGHAALVEGQRGLREGLAENNRGLGRLELKVDGLEYKVDGLAVDLRDTKTHLSKRLVQIERHLGLNGVPKRKKPRTK